jgi:hypothetical protein
VIDQLTLNEHARKAAVFHVMYGTFPAANEAEMRDWRRICAEFINGERPTFPDTLEAYRSQVHS